MNKAELAKMYFQQGYNCSQAVLLSFCDELDIDNDTAAKISLGFGGGIGRLREVCGAFSGIVMAVSIKYADKELDYKNKKDVYSQIQYLSEKFKEKNGSIICKELLNTKETGGSPEKRTDEYYKKRPCPEIVATAAAILEEYFE